MFGTTVVYTVRRWAKRRYAAHTCTSYLYKFTWIFVEWINLADDSDNWWGSCEHGNEVP